MGETGLFGGQRVLKSHPRVGALGEVDELNAHLGLAAGRLDQPDLQVLLERLQAELFIVGADLATPEESETAGRRPAPRITESRAAALERVIDQLEEELEPLTAFILPGGTPAAAQVHVARTVCRRAERAAVEASGKEAINPEAIVYLNRLSDLLFVLARVINRRAGVIETQWHPPE